MDEIRMTASSRTRRGDRNRYGHARRPQDGCAAEESTAGFRKGSFAAGTRCVPQERRGLPPRTRRPCGPRPSEAQWPCAEPDPPAQQPAASVAQRMASAAEDQVLRKAIELLKGEARK